MENIKDYILKETKVELAKYEEFTSEQVGYLFIKLCSVNKMDDVIEKILPKASITIKKGIIKYANDKFKDALINDESGIVRGAIGEYGNNTYKEMLINDVDEYVLISIAKTCNKEQAQRLSTHSNKIVRDTALYRLEELKRIEGAINE